MNTREFKIAEINRILPMIRETIKKKENLISLENELEEKQEILYNIKDELANLNTTIKVSNLDESLKQQLEIFIQKKEEEKQEMETLIENYKARIKTLKNQVTLEKDVFAAIGNAIGKNTPKPIFEQRKFYGLFEITELQKEFLKEYAYFLEISGNLYEYNFLLINDSELGEKLEKEIKRTFNYKYEEFFKSAFKLVKNENDE